MRSGYARVGLRQALRAEPETSGFGLVSCSRVQWKSPRRSTCEAISRSRSACGAFAKPLTHLSFNSFSPSDMVAQNLYLQGCEGTGSNFGNVRSAEMTSLLAFSGSFHRKVQVPGSSDVFVWTAQCGCSLHIG